MPIYISLMYQVMKDNNCHEGVIEQINTLFRAHLLNENPVLDEAKRLRIDDVETNDDIQAKIKAAWQKVDNDNFSQLADYESYHQDFLHLFGFDFDEVDYEEDVDPIVKW